MDGKAHINVYSRADTVIGRIMSNFTKYKMCTVFGEFMSIEGFWHYMSIDAPDEEKEVLRTAYGYNAQKLGKDLKKKYGSRMLCDTAVDIMAFYIREKFVHYEEYLTEDMYNLPLKHYFVFNDYVVDKTEEYEWWLNIIDEMRTTIVHKRVAEHMINDLKEKYKGEPLPEEEKELYRDIYRTLIPKYIRSDKLLYTWEGKLLSNGCDGVRLTDYGAFLIISPERLFNTNANILIQSGDVFLVDVFAVNC